MCVFVHRLHGTPRNPYNVNHYTGGSSSGSAAAVAAGKRPVRPIKKEICHLMRVQRNLILGDL